MAEPHYLEECCWDWIRDQCRKDGRCACQCHTVYPEQNPGPQPDEMVRLQQALDAAEREIDRLNRLVDTLSRALAWYQDADDEVGGDDPVDHPYQRRGSWSGDDWCAVEGCTSKASAHP